VSLLRQGKAQCLTVYLDESDQWQGMPLYAAIVQFLRDQGCAGATATRAVAGYGAGTRLHKDSGWHLSSDAPLIIQVVDQPDRIRRMLPQLQEMLHEGLITLHDVEVLKYTHALPHGLPPRLPVRQVMETLLTSVSPTTPVAAIIDVLLEAPFRVLPVVDERRQLQGIISTGDLINADILPMRRGLVRKAMNLDDTTAEAIEVPLQEARLSSRTAQEIMNRRLHTVRPDQSLREAAEIMLTANVRRLPVVDADGTLVGMLTRTDLLRAAIASPVINSDASRAKQSLARTNSSPGTPVQQQPIENYITTDVATVGEQAPLTEVIDILVLSALKRVVVIDQQHHVRGIISDVDILAHIQEEMRPRFLSVLANWARGKAGRLPTGALHTQLGKARIAADVLNQHVVTVTTTTSVQETIEKMMATGRKILPVVDAEERLVGTISRSDLLRILIEV
jgi:CBS domain-containing protein